MPNFGQIGHRIFALSLKNLRGRVYINPFPVPARINQSTMEKRIASDINQVEYPSITLGKNINKHFSMVTCRELLVADGLAGPSAQMSHPAVVPLGRSWALQPWSHWGRSWAL